MNAQNLELAKGLVDGAYIDQGAVELRKREALVRILLSQRCIPEEPWEDESIRLFLHQLSAMDSNNFSGSVGAGEREARVFSSLVRERHYGMGHGIGRSGDIAAVQPKAAGSSLIYSLTNRLVLHATKLCGITRASAALVLPLATGMSLSLTLQAARASRPDRTAAQYVVWSRIDQKSCFKCMATAGLTPIVVDPILHGDELHTDVEGMRAAIACVGPGAVAAIMTTTSCFAPRAPDDVQAVARLCKELDIPHIINNAYGLQSSKICHEVNEACRVGRVDAWVSSSDKNFMVPVGGAIVAGPGPALVDAVSRLYPGRASCSPIVDLFITFLSMGQSGLKALLAQRKEAFALLKTRLQALAAEHGERVLDSPRNPISIAMSIDHITARSSDAASASSPTYLGSMLFSRGVSGTRVVSPGERKGIDGVTFTGYGASHDAYPCAYLTSAAAMGMTVGDVSLYADRLGRTVAEYKRQTAQAQAKGQGKEGQAHAAAETGSS